jgi:hypothetical protein
MVGKREKSPTSKARKTQPKAVNNTDDRNKAMRKDVKKFDLKKSLKLFTY